MFKLRGARCWRDILLGVAISASLAAQSTIATLGPPQPVFGGEQFGRGLAAVGDGTTTA
ncbi:MAG: hypothetical protein IPK60_20715 [Sandaracinaceae bacterium]|nr:hypothetical protein [Sandaracinaceae bacterium]